MDTKGTRNNFVYHQYIFTYSIFEIYFIYKYIFEIYIQEISISFEDFFSKANSPLSAVTIRNQILDPFYSHSVLIKFH